MITLALLNVMNDSRVAGLTKNQDFFWEEAPLQSKGKPAHGVWLVTRGGDASNSPKGLNLKTTVDFYVAFGNKTQTEVVHRQILDWLLENPTICSLSGSVGGKYYYSYSNIRIRPTSTPENVGTTENGEIVKVASALLTYDQD